MTCERDDDLSRACTAMVTALAHSDAKSYRQIADEIEASGKTECAVHVLAGFVVGVLRRQGDARLLMAKIGPQLEVQRDAQ